MPDGGWGGGHTHSLTHYNERADHDDALAAVSDQHALAALFAGGPSRNNDGHITFTTTASTASAASAAATDQWQGVARCRAEEVCETEGG